MLMALPPLASELLAAVLAAITTLIAVRRRPIQLNRPDDVEDRIADLTLKVQHPWQYRVRRWMR